VISGAATVTGVATSTDVAQWMVDRIRANGCEDQEFFVREIGTRFGTEWDCFNNDHNRVMHPRVLRAFANLHGGTIEWERGNRRWCVV